MNMIRNMILVALGGSVGAVLRFVVSKAVQENVASAFPWGTLLVNVAGCFLLGSLYALSGRYAFLSPGVRLMLTVGLCGGLTTFSTFCNEGLQLFSEENVLYGALYMGASVFLGVTAVSFGNFVVVRFLN